MLENMQRKEMIEKAFNDIVARGCWNIIEGEEIVDEKDLLREIPEKMYRHINRGGEGDSFVFSSYLMKVLHDQGIPSGIVSVFPFTEILYAVMYQDGEEFFIANPSTLIKRFTEKQIIPELRNFTLYSPENKYKNSRVPLQEFANEYGQVSYLGDFFSAEKGSIPLEEAVKQTKIIATPDYTLEQFIKDSKPDLYCEKRPELTCIDGYKFSVQASSSHYSLPRIDSLDEYQMFEVAGITEDLIWELQEFVEDPKAKYVVYAFVPSDKIQEVIDNHGGLNKKVIQKAISDLKECYKTRNTELDSRLVQAAGGNEYLLKILRYAARKSTLTQTSQAIQNQSQQNNGGNNDGQK